MNISRRWHFAFAGLLAVATGLAVFLLTPVTAGPVLAQDGNSCPASVLLALARSVLIRVWSRGWLAAATLKTIPVSIERQLCCLGRTGAWAE